MSYHNLSQFLIQTTKTTYKAYNKLPETGFFKESILCTSQKQFSKNIPEFLQK